MKRGKTWMVAGVIALATGASGVAATVLNTSGSLPTQASRFGNAQRMDAAIAHTKASQAEVQALTDALQTVQLNVAGHAIPNYVIGEAVLNSVQKPGSLATPSALQGAIAKAMAQLAIRHLLYVYGVQAGYGVSPARVKEVEDYETALATRNNPGVIPAGQTPYSYFHSATYTNEYTTDIIIKKMKEKVTGTGDIITPAQAPQIASRLHAWALTVFPTSVTITGMPGVSPLSLANIVG